MAIRLSWLTSNAIMWLFHHERKETGGKKEKDEEKRFGRPLPCMVRTML
jgi:hypothetical protein